MTVPHWLDKGYHDHFAKNEPWICLVYNNIRPPASHSSPLLHFGSVKRMWLVFAYLTDIT